MFIDELTKLSCVVHRWMCHVYTWARGSSLNIHVHATARASSLNTHVYTLPCTRVARGSSLNIHVHARRFIAELPVHVGFFFLQFIAELFWNYKVNPMDSCLGEKKALISRIFVWWMCLNITFNSVPYVTSWLPSFVPKLAVDVVYLPYD